MVKENQLHILNAVYMNDYLWFSALGWNGYYRMNIKTGKLSYLGKFDHYDPFKSKIFYRILKDQQYIFFVPWFSDYLVRLDTRTMETRYWKVPKEVESHIAKFRAAYMNEGKIIMFPMFGNTICLFDLQTLEFKSDTSWNSKKWEINGDFVQGCQVKDNLYVPVLTSSFLLKYNLNNKNHELISFRKEEKGVVKVVPYKDQELLILSWIGNIWKYHTISGKSEMLYQYEGEEDCPYSNLIVCGKKIYILPAHEENIRVFSNGKIKSIEYPTEWRKKSEDSGVDWCISECWIEENDMLLYPALGNMVLNLNIETERIKGIKISERAYMDFFLNHMEKYKNTEEKKNVGSQIWRKMTI